MNRLFLMGILCGALAIPCAPSIAQELLIDTHTTAKARVIGIVSAEVHAIPGTDVESTFQTLTAEILDGPEKSRRVTVENDYLSLEEGEVFYLVHTVNAAQNLDVYTVSEPYRLPALILFGLLFVGIVVALGGRQGIRGLLSLVGGIALIAYILLPGIFAGHSPILLSIGTASLIVTLGSYITHGFTKTTTAAVFGMIATILVTGILAHVAITYGRLSGFSSEEAVYLNFNTRGAIDFAGLLFSGIIIGLLGVLYDAAIGQAVAVEELHHVGPHLPRSMIYARAVRIGREHIGALVNTLAIAYVGASLPLFLLFYGSQESFLFIANREIFATEIIRALIGSIGIVLAVPVTTLVAVTLLIKGGRSKSADLLEKEERRIESFEHHH